MAKRKNSTGINSDLRERAEEKLKNHEINPEHLSPEEVQHLLHELNVHQIELEMQNDELRKPQLELEQARRDYMDLFDYAPIGYVIFSRGGVVEKVNNTAAVIFDRAKDAIEQKPFVTFLVQYSDTGFFGHLDEVLRTKRPQTRVLEMRRPNRPTIWIKLLTVPILDDKGDFIHFRTAIIDITDVSLFKVGHH